MRTSERSRRMRGPAMTAFVLDAVGAAVFVSMMAFGDTRMTPRDGFVLSALLFGSFSALGSILIAAPAPRAAISQGTQLPGRRKVDRRVVNLGNPNGVERRSGRDRRVTHLALGAILAPRADRSAYQIGT
jgi:hypothetical protein